MTDLVCYEWSVAKEAGLSDIVEGKPGDTIIFPHVSSCCAFVFIYGDRILGGHATMLYEGAPPTETDQEKLFRGCALDMLTRLHAKGGKAAPGFILTISSIGTWNTPVYLALNDLDGLQSAQYGKCIGALDDESDIFYKSGTTMLQAQTWNKTAASLLKKGQKPIDTGSYSFSKTLMEIKMESLNFF